MPGAAGPRPFVIDSPIFDEIAADSNAAALIQRAVHGGDLEILVTHVQEDEIAATPNIARRKLLQNAVPWRKVVLSPGAIYDVSKYGQATWPDKAVDADLRALASRRRHAEDALIGVTAKREGATLVTEDKRFSKRAARQGVAVMDWAQFSAYLQSL
jgi:predicted nucleic acid-binding protein